jgi:hypothetical protein
VQCENTVLEGDIVSTSSLVHGQKTKLSVSGYVCDSADGSWTNCMFGWVPDCKGARVEIVSSVHTVQYTLRCNGEPTMPARKPPL